MSQRERLLGRLEAIGKSVAASGRGLAVIGLGSVGQERERLDDYSDLDFFVIVEDGFKARYIEQLDWLGGVASLAYAFRNTGDGYKALFEDGIFCEFAVFEQAELRNIPYAPGRIVWKRADVAESIAEPVNGPRSSAPGSAEWMVGEALTNLYVGLCRFRRGEKLSAARFVQQYAVDRVIELEEMKGNAGGVKRDPFSGERRLEQRHPELAARLPLFVQGYERTPESAEAILDHLGESWEINPAMAEAIRRMCRGD